MRRMVGLGLAGLGATAAALSLPWQAEGHVWRFHADHVLGTSFDMTVVAPRPLAGALAIDAARSEINRLDPILSAWRSDSELVALNTAARHAASPDLFAVIAACEDWRARTGGAYSARVGRVLQACGDRALAVAANAAGLRLDPVSRTIERPEAVVFAVDGLAKGYVIDRALERAACVPGVEGVMIDIGGDLRCWGKPARGEGWRIGVVDVYDPSDNAATPVQLSLRDRAVATSGRSTRNQPIVSPLTGAHTVHASYATAIANRAMDADALATAFLVLQPHDSIALADTLPDVAARIVTVDGSEHVSKRWQDYCAQTTPQRIAQDGGGWPAGFALNIAYDVPRVATSSYHNPYMALWITDENRKLVRTLLVLGTEGRYREENYVYWRRFGRLNTKQVDSVSKPTRAPGHYTLKWDGLDDSGKKVPQGTYVLNIEASREKGGHTVQRLELTLGATAAMVEVPAAEEIGKVRATYGRSI